MNHPNSCICQTAKHSHTESQRGCSHTAQSTTLSNAAGSTAQRKQASKQASPTYRLCAQHGPAPRPATSVAWAVCRAQGQAPKPPAAAAMDGCSTNRNSCICQTAKQSHTESQRGCSHAAQSTTLSNAAGSAAQRKQASKPHVRSVRPAWSRPAASHQCCVGSCAEHKAQAPEATIRSTGIRACQTVNKDAGCAGFIMATSKV